MKSFAWGITTLASVLVAGAAVAKDLSRSAQQKSGAIFDEDYPLSAVRNREEGTSVVMFTILPNGRTTHCKISASSGSNALDLKTCELIATRFEYDPARNSKGQAIEEVKTQRVTWRIPSQAPILEPSVFETILIVEGSGRVSDCGNTRNGQPFKSDETDFVCRNAAEVGFAPMPDGKRRRVVARSSTEITIIE